MPGPTPAWTNSRVEFIRPLRFSRPVSGGEGHGAFVHSFAQCHLYVSTGNAVRAVEIGGVIIGSGDRVFANVRAPFVASGNALLRFTFSTQYTSLASRGSVGWDRIHQRLVPGAVIGAVTPTEVVAPVLRTYSDAARTTLLETINLSATEVLPGNTAIRAALITDSSLTAHWQPEFAFYTPRTLSQVVSDTVSLAPGSHSANAVYNRTLKRFEHSFTGLNAETAYTITADGRTGRATTAATADPRVYEQPTYRRTAVTATSATYAFPTPTGGTSPYLQVFFANAWRTITRPFTIGAGDETWNPALAASTDGTAYAFRARWVNSTGPTNGTEVTISGRTRSSRPGIPREFSLSGTLDNLRGEWQAPDAVDYEPAQSYQYVLRTSEVTDLATLATATDLISTTATSFTVAGQAFTQYWAYLRAVRGTFFSDWTEANIATTPEAEPATTGTIVEWDQVAGFTYELRSDVLQEWRPATSPHVLPSLPPNTEVGIEVRAIWRGRAGAPRRITQLTYPSGVQVPRITRIPASNQLVFQFGEEVAGASLQATIERGAHSATVPVSPDASLRWTWTATGDFLGAGSLTFTFFLSNATGSGPTSRAIITAPPQEDGPTFGIFVVWSATIITAVPVDAYKGSGQTLQFRLAGGTWRNALERFAGDPRFRGLDLGGGALTPDTEYTVEARVLDATGNPSATTSRAIRTAPRQPHGLTHAGTYTFDPGGPDEEVRNSGAIAIPNAAVGDVYYVSHDIDFEQYSELERLVVFETSAYGGATQRVILPTQFTPHPDGTHQKYKVYASNISYGTVVGYSIPALIRIPDPE